MSVLLAPIQINPTKALSPSHLKALLWLDVAYKATARIRPVHYLWNRATFDVAVQILGFWHYLEKKYGADATYADRTEVWTTEEYVQYHQGPRDLPKPVLDGYRRAIDDEQWIHPASRRILEIWKQQYEVLGLHDPGLTYSSRPSITPAEVLQNLAPLNCLLDLRRIGGATYLDFTDAGVPLRQIVDEFDVYNYLLSVLRELIPIASRYELVVLAYDRELELDYQLVRRTLERLGTKVSTMVVDRVPINGLVQSARNSGWQAYALGSLLERLVPRYELRSLRLGLRLYFILHLGMSSKDSFGAKALHRFVEKAARIIEQLEGLAPGPQEQVNEVLRRCARRRGWVSPYRLTSMLMTKNLDPAVRRSLLDLYV